MDRQYLMILKLRQQMKNSDLFYHTAAGENFVTASFGEENHVLFEPLNDTTVTGKIDFGAVCINNLAAEYIVQANEVMEGMYFEYQSEMGKFLLCFTTTPDACEGVCFTAADYLKVFGTDLRRLAMGMVPPEMIAERIAEQSVEYEMLLGRDERRRQQAQEGFKQIMNRLYRGKKNRCDDDLPKLTRDKCDEIFRAINQEEDDEDKDW